MNVGNGVHLTYCSNIHPGETWEAVQANLENYLPLIRAQVCPGQQFGIGLRLSAQAADALANSEKLALFMRFLDKNNLYVFTINGFPYGAFHGVRVKEAVYLPDWRSRERLRYTNVLATLLSRLLTLQEGLHGSISTVPGAYKSEVRSLADVELMRDNLVRHVGHLVTIQRSTGKLVQLALEPEPCCFLETIEEAVAFFQQHLFGRVATYQLMQLTGLNKQQAEQALHSHLGLCLDLCHAAVEFEDAHGCLQHLSQAGITIVKMQVSAGLRITDFSPPSLEALRTYIDPVYLHQVVELGPNGLRRFSDLPEAFASLAESRLRQEWRVHFHVPIFQEQLGPFQSTRSFIEDVLSRQRIAPLSQHLEIETYTWDVLPAALKEDSVDKAIVRELKWMQEMLAT